MATSPEVDGSVLTVVLLRALHEGYGNAHNEDRLSIKVDVEQVMAAVRQAAEGLLRLPVVEVSDAGAQLTARMNMKTRGSISLQFHP